MQVINTLDDLTAELIDDFGNKLSRAVVDNSFEGICVCHEILVYPFLQFTLWNKRMYEITGYTQEEINQLGWFQTFYPEQEDYKQALQRKDKIKKEQTLYSPAIKIVVANNHTKLISASTMLLDREDLGTHFLTFVHDVTEKHALKLNLINLASIVDYSSDAILSCNREHKIISWNVAAIKLFGYTTDEIMGKSLFTLIPPEGKDEAIRHISESYVGKESSAFNTICLSKAGIPINVSAMLFLRKELNGTVIGPAAIIRDIRSQVAADLALRDSESQLKAVFDLAPDGVLLVDTMTQQLVLANPAICQMLQHTQDELLTMSLVDIHPPEWFEFIINAFSACAAGDSSTAQNIQFMRNDKSIFYADISTTIMVIKNRSCLLSIIHDITLRKEYEGKLVTDKESAEALSVTKANFLSTMTHELRSPLNSILGFTEILDKEMYGPLNEKQKEFTADILDSGKHLLALISDVLDMAKIDAGKMQLNLNLVDVNKLVSESLKLIQQNCVIRNIHLVDLLDANIPEVMLDERKIKQVLFNVLSNALKFTLDNGVISVSSYQKDGQVVIAIQDNGIGVNAKEEHKIFTDFEQIDSSQAKKYAGSGVGMPISKKLIELHGGEIWFASSGLGHGTTFFIALPIPESLGLFQDDDLELRSYWSEHHRTNVIEIDDQHQQIIDIMNLLIDGMETGMQPKLLHDIFKTLFEYFKFHFATEQQMMLAYDYPNTPLHIQIHQEYLVKIEQLLAQLALDSNKAQEIYLFISDWINNHILAVDKDLGVFLNSKGIY